LSRSWEQVVVLVIGLSRRCEHDEHHLIPGGTAD
jgi:hypothetical protein